MILKKISKSLTVVHVIYCLLLFQSNGLYGQQTNKRLGYFEMNLLSDYRYAFKDASIYQFTDTTYTVPVKERYEREAYGFGFRIQSSIIANFLELRENKKFRFGDLFAAEISTGVLSKFKTTEAWFAYKFEFGVGFIRQLHENHELGINLFFLKFASDWVSENISGSSISVRYRMKQYVLNIGVESQGTRFLGWIQDVSSGGKTPVRYSVIIQKLIGKKSTLGAKAEFTSNDYVDGSNMNRSNIQQFITKIFYGIYF